MSKKDNEIITEKSKTIVEAFDKLEKEYGERFGQIFKTVTFDNGSEFLD